MSELENAQAEATQNMFEHYALRNYPVGSEVSFRTMSGAVSMPGSVEVVATYGSDAPRGGYTPAATAIITDFDPNRKPEHSILPPSPQHEDLIIGAALGFLVDILRPALKLSSDTSLGAYTVPCTVEVFGERPGVDLYVAYHPNDDEGNAFVLKAVEGENGLEVSTGHGNRHANSNFNPN